MATEKTEQSNLKTLVRGAYNIQKLRIQTGNRITGNFKAKLGQNPSESESGLSEEAKELLLLMRLRNRSITTSITEELRAEIKEAQKIPEEALNKRLAGVIKSSFVEKTEGRKTFPTPSKFTGDAIISDYTELCLLEQYFALEKNEASHFTRLEAVLKGYPIYTQFLKDVRGIGPTIAAVLISEIDIHKAKYASSLHKLCGLDTVVWFECKVKHHTQAPDRVETRHPNGYVTQGPAVIKEKHDWFTLYTEDGTHLGKYGLPPRDTKGLYQGRSRRAEHLVEVEYTDINGVTKTKQSITFKPFLKTKLVGVLGASFLRSGNNPYAEHYYEYKARLEKDPRHADKTKLHLHNMSTRKMIKKFLIDLYVNWRTLEGLQVMPSYQEAKLGSASGTKAASNF